MCVGCERISSFNEKHFPPLFIVKTSFLCKIMDGFSFFQFFFDFFSIFFLNFEIFDFSLVVPFGGAVMQHSVLKTKIAKLVFFLLVLVNSTTNKFH